MNLCIYSFHRQVVKMADTSTRHAGVENPEANGVVNGTGDDDKANYRPADIDAVSHC